MLLLSKIKLSLSCLILSIISLFIIWQALSWYQFLTQPLNLTGKDTTIIVTENMSLPKLAHQLSKRKLLSNSSFSSFWLIGEEMLIKFVLANMRLPEKQHLISC